MIANFENPAPLDDGNRIRLAHSRKSMGNDDAGPSSKEAIKGHLNLPFRRRVDARRGFVENQDGRIL